MLHRLRHAHTFARFILVWFVLSIGVAVASPMVNPQATELICSSAGVMKVIVKAADGSSKEVASVGGSHLLDCPMCAAASAPPPVLQLGTAPVLPLSYALQSIPAARIAALVGAPLPARGPPARS